MPGIEDVAERLWRFSLAYYARAGIAPALLRLQDRDRCDVVLILLALWAGWSGYAPLRREDVAAACEAGAPIRTGIVERLRMMRRDLDREGPPDIRRLRDALQALEIEAERAYQARLLAAISLSPGEENVASVRRGVARSNLALHLSPEALVSTEASLLIDSLHDDYIAP